TTVVFGDWLDGTVSLCGPFAGQRRPSKQESGQGDWRGDPESDLGQGRCEGWASPRRTAGPPGRRLWPDRREPRALRCAPVSPWRVTNDLRSTNSALASEVRGSVLTPPSFLTKAGAKPVTKWDPGSCGTVPPCHTTIEVPSPDARELLFACQRSTII